MAGDVPVPADSQCLSLYRKNKRVKNNIKYRRLIKLLTACLLLVGTFSGCRGIKYLMYYPHPVLGAITPTAQWREFTISPLTLEKYDYLAVSFNQDGRTVCQNNLSAFHL